MWSKGHVHGLKATYRDLLLSMSLVWASMDLEGYILRLDIPQCGFLMGYMAFVWLALKRLLRDLRGTEEVSTAIWDLLEHVLKY